MNIAIYGTNIYSITLKDIIIKGYNPLSVSKGREALTVVAYIGEDIDKQMIDDIPILTMEQSAMFFKNQLFDALVLPLENYVGQRNYLQEIHFMGVSFDHIYIAHRLDDELATENGILRMFSLYNSCSYLPYLEYHIADHCNLNCAACEHYSGLVQKEHFPNFIQFRRDLLRLKELIRDIGVIRILGGEPLLNNEIEKYIKLTRKIYPVSDIYVVTNGLLLRKMPDTFFETIKANNIHIWISFYLPLESKMEGILQFLSSKGVSVMLSPLNRTFTKKQRLVAQDFHQTEKVFWNCYQHSCNNLYEGKLAACFLPFTTKYFNQYFHKALPEDGAIDLYDEELTTELLKQKLSQPFERCRFCYLPAENVDWRVMHHPSVLEDWIMTDKQ